jgi:MFS family permease
VSGESPFQSRDFRLLLLGQTTSQLGAQVSGVAVPLLAVLTLRATPLQLGLVTASGTLAFALVGLPAGAWVDRWRRRPILISSDLVRSGVLATIPLAALLGLLTIKQLIVVSFVVGFARVFFDIGYQSYVPTVVGKKNMLGGNSAMETIRSAGQVVGPGLGGWLVAAAGAANVVFVQAVTFAVSAASLIAIRTREPAAPARPDQARLGTEIYEGLRFLAGNRLLRATAFTSAAGNFAFAVASTVSLLFMVRVVGLSPTAIGVVLAFGSVTVMAGAALTPRLARAFGSARIIWLSLAATGPLTILGPLARPGWLSVLILISTAAGELGQIIYAITNLSLRQRLCPERLLGRVNAAMKFAIMGLFPLGALLGGILGEYVGLRVALLVAGVIIVLSPVPVYRALHHIRDVDELSGLRSR